jgi:tol-pal system protein YbgF
MMDQELTAAHDDPGEKLYRAGLVQLKANNYSQALNQFQTLQRRYPKSSLSEPAEFFAANALYEMGKYDQAILQFNDQTMRFPKGHFASAALLREAQAFMKINDRIDARLTLQKLLNDLPDSPEAPMAKSMMQTLAS